MKSQVTEYRLVKPSYEDPTTIAWIVYVSELSNVIAYKPKVRRWFQLKHVPSGGKAKVYIDCTARWAKKSTTPKICPQARIPITQSIVNAIALHGKPKRGCLMG